MQFVTAFLKKNWTVTSLYENDKVEKIRLAEVHTFVALPSVF